MDNFHPQQAKDHYIHALEIDPAYKPALLALEILGDEGPKTGNIRSSFLKSLSDD